MGKRRGSKSWDMKNEFSQPASALNSKLYKSRRTSEQEQEKLKHDLEKSIEARSLGMVGFNQELINASGMAFDELTESLREVSSISSKVVSAMALGTDSMIWPAPFSAGPELTLDQVKALEHLESNAQLLKMAVLYLVVEDLKFPHVTPDISSIRWEKPKQISVQFCSPWEWPKPAYKIEVITEGRNEWEFYLPLSVNPLNLEWFYGHVANSDEFKQSVRDVNSFDFSGTLTFSAGGFVPRRPRETLESGEYSLFEVPEIRWLRSADRGLVPTPEGVVAAKVVNNSTVTHLANTEPENKKEETADDLHGSEDGE